MERYSDPYRVLGVTSDASQQDIARAYRRAAQRVHPDTQPDDPRAAARFQVLADAYELLRDPSRRADYDHARLADEPISQPAQSRRPRPAPRSSGWPYLLPPAPGQPIWAGPVHVEPAGLAGQHGPGVDPAATRFEDPPVFLDSLTWAAGSWPC